MKIFSLVLLLSVSFFGTTHAAPDTFDTQMASIVDLYLAIHTQLASDTLTDVAKNAASIRKAVTRLDSASVKGEHAAHFKPLPAKISAAASALADAKDIKAARAAFKGLSRPLVMWASMRKPKDISVLYCSMAKGSWLQRDTAVRNPYYGASMLACGEIVEGVGKGAASGHMKGH